MFETRQLFQSTRVSAQDAIPRANLAGLGTLVAVGPELLVPLEEAEHPG